VKIRPILIEEANELYDMGIINITKLVEWPFYSATRMDSLALNKGKGE